MPPRRKQELTFLVSTGPDDESQGQNRRRVRSLAALNSWPGRRKRTHEQHKDSVANSGASTFLIERSDLNEANISRPRKPPSSYSRRRPARQNSQSYRIRSHFGHELCLEKEEGSLSCLCTQCQYERRSTLQSRAKNFALQRGYSPYGSPTSTPSDRAEPFNQYPIAYEPWVDRVLHHLMNVFAPRGWPALGINNAQGLHWEWFATQLSLSEPAFFWVRLLYASGDLVRVGVLKPSFSYWLRAKAVSAINEALRDPKRATSEALIMAVGRIAMHEAWFGDKEAAHNMHRPAQYRMVQMRGGMDALEFPELVKRLMRWADDLMARQGKTRRFLADDIKRDWPINRTVDALESWVPNSGVPLRQSVPVTANDDHGW